MATAVVEERQLLKTLRWWDGFTIALCNPGFLIASLLGAYGALGVIGATVLWGTAALVALLSVWIYSEPAMMFPGRSGGISLYANEGWRRYTTLVGPVATFGYWIGWSVVLSIFGNIIGSLIQAQWFPHSNWTVYDGVVHLELFNFIGIGCIVAVWLFNIFGVRLFAWFTYVTGALLMIPLCVLIFGPAIAGHWHSSNVHWTLASNQWGGVKIALVWLFIMTWSAGGVEVCATFTPEYKSERDSTIALRSAATFSLLVYILLPLGLGGYTGIPSSSAILANSSYVTAFNTLVGHGAADVFLILLILSLLLSMASSTADAGRALYGISRVGLTIKQLGTLNRYHVPGRAMTVDLVVNTCLILFISSNLAILYMSNIGYVMCHVLAMSGFLLLRKDRPNWPRPLRVGAGWVAVAGMLLCYYIAILVVGAGSPKLNGYGDWTDFFIGIGILVASILLFFYRRVVQDKESIHWKESVPTMPEGEDRAALLQVGWTPETPAASVPVGS
ncbi:MAG TPA: APC family permease [Solirubrobacteraceae bacterium]|nr:APC family permease [Solirubrobacteraceae bacterium]